VTASGRQEGRIAFFKSAVGGSCNFTCKIRGYQCDKRSLPHPDSLGLRGRIGGRSASPPDPRKARVPRQVAEADEPVRGHGRRVAPVQEGVSESRPRPPPHIPPPIGPFSPWPRQPTFAGIMMIELARRWLAPDPAGARLGAGEVRRTNAVSEWAARGQAVASV
jgi:hypothetical protein